MAFVITIIPTNIGIMTGSSVANAATKPFESRQVWQSDLPETDENAKPERIKIGGKYFWIEMGDKNKLYCADTITGKGKVLISGTEDELMESKISCNGSTVYFTIENEDDCRQYLYKSSTDGKNRKRLYKFTMGSMPVGIRGNYLYMVELRSDSNGYNLVKMNLSTKKKTTLVNKVEAQASEALGCKYIYYYDRTKSKYPLTRYDCATGKKVTLSKYIDEWRVYPEDPTHLYYIRIAEDRTLNGNKKYTPSLWRSSLTGKNPVKLRDLGYSGFKFMDGMNFCHTREKLYEDHAVWTHYIINLKTLDVYSLTEEWYDPLVFTYWQMMQEDGETPKDELYYEGTLEYIQ